FDSHHRRDIFATEADPPAQFLLGLGFRPGRSRAAMWRRAWGVLLSPAFYARGFYDRVRGNFRSGVGRATGFTLWAALWLSLPFWFPHGLLVLIGGFVLPVICFATLSSLLDRLGEHVWLARSPDQGARFYTASVTAARYCGAPVPARSVPVGPRLLAWIRWTALTVCYQFVADPKAPTQKFGVTEGLQLRIKNGEDAEEPSERDNDLGEGKTKKKAKLDEVAEVRGKYKLDVKLLDRVRRIFRFSDDELVSVLSGKDDGPDEAWCREGRGPLPLAVCRPPHVIVSAARNFAVYSEKFIVVPPRQIGIVSVDSNRPLLKALALYLSS